MNPLLPIKHFVPDVEARVWQNGRIYLYGSYDTSGDDIYCSRCYHVFSSDNMKDWTDHGVSFRTEDTWMDSPLYAPDCVYKDGTYYQYFCMANAGEGVAVSPLPQGPFEQPVPIQGADGDSIDPAVFIDDDGQAYYFWGQFHLKGAKLKPNMTELDMDTAVDNIITEAEHGFHEGASMRKRNGIYYLLYTDISRGRATCISYAMAKSPLGPFQKGGVIIDNTGCDKETWNNHGSMEPFQGKWYIFYHRSSQSSVFNRRVCAEEITFADDGTIAEVEMTTGGPSGLLSPKEEMEAWRACQLSGQVRTEPGYDRDGTLYEALSQIHAGDTATYRYFDFSSPVSTFTVQAAGPKSGGRISLHLSGPEGEEIGVCPLPETEHWGDYQTVSCPVRPVSGVHSLCLVFESEMPGRLCNVKSFRFS